MKTRACVTCGQSFPVSGKTRYCSDDCRHGTDAGYGSGCTCEPCRRAHARNHKRLRCRPNPRVPAIGTHRRIQALARLGWSGAELSRRLGRTRSYLLKVMERDTLEPSTVLAVRRLYDELSMTWCTGPHASRTAADARRRGWAPPLAWDDHQIDDPNGRPHAGARVREVDEVVVERLLAGHWATPSTKPERIEVVRRWTEAGKSLRSLEMASGWNTQRYVDTSDLQEAS